MTEQPRPRDEPAFPEMESDMTTSHMIDELETLLDGSWEETADAAAHDLHEVRFEQSSTGSTYC